jgi:diketogulonate reductase-like aldo/keto reductase
MSDIGHRAKLNNGTEMPWLGFGVFQIDDGSAVEEAASEALRVGYRSIDTAAVYRNEVGTGKAIKESGIPRDEIFLTTKVWNEDQRLGRPLEAIEESLERLDTDYVDLYLVHWPVADHYRDAWQKMQEIYESGRAKAIGVSNFLIHHLDDILADGEVVPAVNQVEFHPRLQSPALVEYCQGKGIHVEAWAPLMKGGVSTIPAIVELGEKYGKTPAQITLRWNLQRQIITIPKSVTPARISENADVFDFELSAEDMETMNGLDEGNRTGPDPDNFGF